ncbi:penicillin-binding protein 1A [Pelotomaculum isophthalicicum JI]|uniref:Penicillin-binding protein 1A n=1 Tax=Pelotomaculum isophthalicicum JI TaxID=947010 RepID=A0A9X4H4N9_9FIRM|nr:penicillin-binding protein 1A [Pelotomaculum isophthalicicum]MDF9407403.1 penicillin-binding protein 1A [Pelotomaculum isophthalicicum JI]
MAKRRARRKLNRRRFFLLVICLAILCVGCVGCGLVYSSIRDVPKLSPSSLESAASTMVYDEDGKLITQIGIKNSVPIELKDVPDNVKNAFLAVEDPRFYQHHGVDLRGIARAAWSDISSGSIREGGSTITQQLVKVSFLSNERTFKRKIQELILALQVERQYTKDEILEMYLNNIYLGEGAYGIQAAAQTYFGKDIKHGLNLEEAALLGGLPQAPSAYSPYLDPQAALSRRNTVLDAMAKNNYISESEAEKAKAKELKIETKEPAERQYPYPYFLDYITDKLIEKYGETEVFKGGLRVYTSLDQNIQQIAEAAMSRNSNFPSSRTDANNVLQPQGAVVLLDPHTGQIKAMVGGREHTQMRQWNRVSQTTRQPGSAFKPIAAYGPAIEYEGMGPASVVDDIPVNYGSYEPRNVDGRYRGLITLRTALTHSVNVVAVKLLMDKVGISDAIKFASGLGIQLDPQKHGASMALGGLYNGVTPLQMASAYGAFANQGIYIEPTAITRVEKADGVILEQSVPKQRQAMKATTAYLITDMLKSVVQNGTGTGAQIGRPAAGKTGTTDDGKDIWFVGYTPELVAAVWIGYDNPTAMPQAFGSTYPAGIWREIMSKALSNVTVKEFPRPTGLVTATVDGKSGLLPGPNTPGDSLVTDLFTEGTVPSESDNIHVFVEVCATSGQLPTERCPDRVIKPLIKLPYSVPSSVEDYNLRVPTQPCTVHEPGASASTSGGSKPLNPAIPGEVKSQPGKQNSQTARPDRGNN